MRHYPTIYLLLLVALSLGWSSGVNAQDSSTTSSIDTVRFSDLSFDEFLALARFENKPFIVLFSASWCAPCHRIKRELFTMPKIAALTNDNYLAYFIDIEDFDGAEINSKYFHVSQLPTILFFNPQGRQMDQAIGFFDGYYFFKKLRAHIPPAHWGKDWGLE